MPIKFLLLGGGGSGFFRRGGVEVPILFLWAWGFFRENPVRHEAEILGSGKTDLVQSKGPFKLGPFAYKRGAFCKQISSS